MTWHYQTTRGNTGETLQEMSRGKTLRKRSLPAPCQTQAILEKNRQMRLHQAKMLLHCKVYTQQSEKATIRIEEKSLLTKQLLKAYYPGSKRSS